MKRKNQELEYMMTWIYDRIGNINYDFPPKFVTFSESQSISFFPLVTKTSIKLSK